MRRQATRANPAMLLGSIAGLLLGAPALAQDESKPSIQQIEAPLRGPVVSDERAPGVDPRFSAGMERSRESERQIPLRVYEKELRALSGADVSEDVRLSTEQQQAIRKALEEHRRETRAYYQEHRAEFAALRAGRGASETMGGDQARGVQPRVSQGIRRGQRQPGLAGDAGRRSPGGADAVATRRDTESAGERGLGGAGAMSPEVREKMQALRAAGPQQGAVIERIWGVLNEAQRGVLEARFEKIRSEEMRKREQRKMEQGANAEGVTAREPAPGQTRAELDAMTPEQRRERVEQFRRRRAEKGGSDRAAQPQRGAPESDD